jgi:hypothetical protein
LRGAAGVCRDRAAAGAAERGVMLSYPSPLWGGWREAPGGGSARQCANNFFAEAAPHPSHRSLRSRCATLPTRGRDKKHCAALTDLPVGHFSVQPL